MNKSSTASLESERLVAWASTYLNMFKKMINGARLSTAIVMAAICIIFC